MTSKKQRVQSSAYRGGSKTPHIGTIFVLKWILFTTIAYLVGKVLWNQLCLLDWKSIRFAPLPLLGAALALGLVFVGRAISVRLLLGGYGYRISWREAAIVGWIPQIGKYIPGQVASWAGGVALLRRFHVSGPVGLTVMAVMDGLAVLTGLVVGAPILLWSPVRQLIPMGWLGCALAILIGAISLHPSVHGRLLNFILKKLKRPPLARLPPSKDYVAPVIMGFAQWILLGIALWLVTLSTIPVAADVLPLFVSIASLAYTVSFLTPFAPGGLGVREGIFQGTLTLLVSTPAVVAVISMRILQVLLEVVMALLGWLLLRREPRRTA